MEKLKIIFEDENIVIVNKPSGMLSVSYPGSTGKTAQTVLEEILRKKGTINSKRKPFAVHRLDRDTSGLLMFAMNEKIQKQIMDDWQKIVTERKYIAVAENSRNRLSDSGIINIPLAYNARNQGYVPSKEAEKNENIETVEARTNYKIIYRGATHTLFELELDTGRKNQIRAHLSHFGYPLAGDKNYRAKTDPFNRLALHACSLEFVHPVTKEKMRFEEKAPKYWAEFVKQGASKPKKTKRQKKAEAEMPLIRRTTRKEEAHMDFIARGKRKCL